MIEENKSTNNNIVSKVDLGNGKRQVTFKVDASDIMKYYSNSEPQDVNNETSSDFKIGIGSVKSRYQPTGFDYMQLYNSNSKSYTQALKTPTDPHEKIRLATELYYKEPIVGTVIDMMVDFSASGFNNECEDKDIKKLYDEWAKEVNLQEIVEQIFLEYFRSGNVSIYRSDKTAKVTKTKKTAKAIAKEEYTFPSGYTILNPMNVFIEGPLLFNQELAYLQLNEELMKMTTEGDILIQKMIPDDVKKAVKSGKGRIPLDPKLYTRITRKKQPYERYATPFLERVFEPILYKQKLRQMDMSTIDGLINQLVTVTVGNDTYPASDEDLEAIASLFQTPNKAYTVFWNHTLEVTFHKPEGIDTLTNDKYKQVNDDILAGLGVSRVLIDGQGANFSTAWVSILSLIERLENTRHKVVAWLESEYKRIAEENNFKVVPKVQFNKMNLREDNYIRDVLLAMYDRGLIDEEDILRETGRDYESIIETKKRNEKNKDLFLPPEQPFQGGQTAPNDGKQNGPNSNPMKKRDITPEQNSGNPPKSKANYAIAYKDQLEEEYETELVDYYNSIKADVIKLAEDNENNGLLDAILLGALIGLFKSLSHIGDRYIDNAYNQEITMHTNNIDANKTNEVKAQLKSWNTTYVNKLASDIRDGIIDNLSKGLPVYIAVNKAFKSNAYRVPAMSEAVVLDSTRQAKIQGNAFEGRQTATWITHLDDRTCGTCRGLDGVSFNISEIPPRPHAYCRCDLDFN